MEQDDADRLEELLEEEPELARTPLEEGWEPPICAAVRLGCPSRIVALLLEFGAVTDQENIQGHTALEILIDSTRRSLPLSVRGLGDIIGDPSLSEMYKASETAMERHMKRQQADLLATAGLLLGASSQLSAKMSGSSLRKLILGEEDRCSDNHKCANANSKSTANNNNSNNNNNTTTTTY